ncbi:SDR family NAD(P)-dependent oxidoreductase [Paraburkholderia caledonica]|uniref:SDR family NAD(P)-dependent oxidoreductase n=1 Tax=Paraburkholderia caledonica TaxID=134536 RepID=UPI0038B7785B
MELKVAVVSGGNRGLGLAIVRQLAAAGYSVVLGSRDLTSGNLEAAKLEAEGFTVRAAQLDITDSASVKALFDSLQRVDVLVNCAGIYLEGSATFSEIDEATLTASIDANAVGAWRMCKAASALMIDQKFGRIVNVSTGWASLNEMQGNAAAYRISKAALNAVTRVVADELASKGDIKVNAVCPGWVRTRMGGPDGQLSPEESARDVLWAAFFDAGGPNGRFFRQRESMPW